MPETVGEDKICIGKTASSISSKSVDSLLDTCASTKFDELSDSISVGCLAEANSDCGLSSNRSTDKVTVVGTQVEDTFAMILNTSSIL